MGARAAELRLTGASLKAEVEGARERRRGLESGFEAPPREVFPESDVEPRLAGWRAAIAVQRKRLEELALLREDYVLRAPASGRVAQLFASEGQYLLAGEPVLVLMDPETSAVALWIPETAPKPPRIGDHFLVARSATREEYDVADCIVQSMSLRLELMPQRLWRDMRIAEYGRACLVGPSSALNLVPGERVRVDPLGAECYDQP